MTNFRQTTDYLLRNITNFVLSSEKHLSAAQGLLHRPAPAQYALHFAAAAPHWVRFIPFLRRGLNSAPQRIEAGAPAPQARIQSESSGEAKREPLFSKTGPALPDRF